MQKAPRERGLSVLGAGGLEPPEAEAGGFTVGQDIYTGTNYTTQAQYNQLVKQV